MANNIKSPMEDSISKGQSPHSKGSSGEYDGLNGYQKRTGGPSGVPEKIIDGVRPAGKVNLKTPATESNGKK